MKTKMFSGKSTNKKRWATAIIAVVVTCTSVLAQTPQFSQFYASPLYLAPSFAGATDGSRVVLNYRNQWPQIPGAFVTLAFSLDHYFHNYRSGLGILLFRDQAGSGRLASTEGGLVYSYNFNLNHRWIMRPGVQFLYGQRTVDFHRHVFGDQLTLDGTLPTTNAPRPIDRVGYFDASSSLMAYSYNAWMGVSVDHLMRPNQSMTQQESRLPMKYTLFGGYRFYFGRDFAGRDRESISIASMFRRQGKFNQFDLGVYWSKFPISLGLLYRGIPLFNNEIHGMFNNDALVLLGALRTNNLRIGYSYDFTISRLINNTGGAHEISLIFQFNQGPPARRQGKIPCPEGQM